MSTRNEVILKKAKEALEEIDFTFPLILLLAMIKQESPRQKGDLSNTNDGILQVSQESGHRGGHYGNTVQGIENNIKDALKTIKDCMKSSGNKIEKAVSQYNGGPYENKGDKQYTDHVAKRITSGEVSENFGAEFSPDKLSKEDKALIEKLEKYKRP